MSTTTTRPAEETLTDDMIIALRDEAASAGDETTVALCAVALASELGETADLDDAAWSALESIGVYAAMVDASDRARDRIAALITDARAQDDSRPFVRVAP